MAEVAKDSYPHRQYNYVQNTITRSMENSNVDLYFGYADSLAKCGKLGEALKVYEHCCKVEDVPLDRLKVISSCLLDAVLNLCDISIVKSTISVYVCVLCDGVLKQPVTVSCGHTFCKKCLVKDVSRTCNKCGCKINYNYFETNIIIQGLVEKFWSGELLSSRLREDGNELYNRNEFELALSKYNEALLLVPEDHLVLSNRSHALHRLGRLQAALTDAELVTKLKPHWGKGYYRKGTALAALGRDEEALISFCACVALDKNPQLVRLDVSRIIHRLLTPKRRHRFHLATNNYQRLRKSRYFSHTMGHYQSPVLDDTSDCEENSSDEEDLKKFSDRTSNIQQLVDKLFRELDKLKRVENKPPRDLTIEPCLVDRADFDCVLCCRTLWRPVTTPCGHTYCMVCLDRSLDYSNSCPLCMKSLAEYFTVTCKNATEFLERAVKTLLPSEYVTRQLLYTQEVSELSFSSLEKEHWVPVFVCTTAYPYVPCPLFIYEPRYRLMVRRCLEAGTKQFAIAACTSSEVGVKRFAEFGTMLEVKDRVLMSDGCSILTTVGLRRFKILSKSEKDGYDTAKVEYLEDEKIPDCYAPALTDLHDKVRENALSWMKTFTKDFQEQILGSFGPFPDVEKDWICLPDGPAWTWWLLAILPLGPQLQVGILGTTSLEKRLRAIDKTLSHIQQRMNTIQAT